MSGQACLSRQALSQSIQEPTARHVARVFHDLQPTIAAADCSTPLTLFHLVLESDRSRNANKEDLPAYLVRCRTPACTSLRFGHSATHRLTSNFAPSQQLTYNHLYRPLPLPLTIHHDFLLKTRARCHVEFRLGSYHLVVSPCVFCSGSYLHPPTFLPLPPPLDQTKHSSCVNSTTTTPQSCDLLTITYPSLFTISSCNKNSPTTEFCSQRHETWCSSSNWCSLCLRQLQADTSISSLRFGPRGG